jgi:hypothetical protein
MIDEIDLVPLTLEHGRWRRLCARLETIADALPTLPSVVQIAALRAQLREAFSEGVQGSEFPIRHLFDREGDELPARHMLDRLCERRALLAVQAQDLADMIGAEARDRTTPDTLGYMLRNVFAGCSEAMAEEVLALLLVAPNRLTTNARAYLLDRIQSEESVVSRPAR